MGWGAEHTQLIDFELEVAVLFPWNSAIEQKETMKEKLRDIADGLISPRTSELNKDVLEWENRKNTCKKYKKFEF